MDRWSVTCWDQHLPALWQAAERLKGQFCLSARTYTHTSTVEHAIALETPIFCYQGQLSIVYILTTGYLLSKSSVIFVFFHCILSPAQSTCLLFTHTHFHTFPSSLPSSLPPHTPLSLSGCLFDGGLCSSGQVCWDGEYESRQHFTVQIMTAEIQIIAIMVHIYVSATHLV